MPKRKRTEGEVEVLSAAAAAARPPKTKLCYYGGPMNMIEYIMVSTIFAEFESELVSIHPLVEEQVYKMNVNESAGLRAYDRAIAFLFRAKRRQQQHSSATEEGSKKYFQSENTTILVSFGIWRIRSEEDILYVDVFENNDDEDSSAHNWKRICNTNSIKMSDKDAFLDEFSRRGRDDNAAAVADAHRFVQQELSNRLLAAFLTKEDLVHSLAISLRVN